MWRGLKLYLMTCVVLAAALALSTSRSIAQTSADTCPDGSPRYFGQCPSEGVLADPYIYPINFDTIPVPARSPYYVAAEDRLHDVGISVSARTPADSRIVFMNNLGEYGGRALRRTVSDVFLTQVDTNNVPASFTLQFRQPVRSVSIMVPGIFPASASGVTFPAWTVTALSRSGAVLSSHQEGLRRRFNSEPAETITLNAPGFEPIVALRFDSDPRLNGVPFAGFSTIHIERLGVLPYQ